MQTGLCPVRPCRFGRTVENPSNPAGQPGAPCQQCVQYSTRLLVRLLWASTRYAKSMVDRRLSNLRSTEHAIPVYPFRVPPSSSHFLPFFSRSLPPFPFLSPPFPLDRSSGMLTSGFLFFRLPFFLSMDLDGSSAPGARGGGARGTSVPPGERCGGGGPRGGAGELHPQGERHGDSTGELQPQGKQCGGGAGELRPQGDRRSGPATAVVARSGGGAASRWWGGGAAARHRVVFFLFFFYFFII